jgi:hypothetical protein
METKKIELQQVREFGEVFNATFAFIRQEIKPLGKAFLVFIIPFLLLMSISMVLFYSNFFNEFTQPNFSDPTTLFVKIFKMYFVILLFALVLQTMILDTVYSYMNLYLKDKENTGIAALFSEIMKNFFPVMGASIIFMLSLIISFVFCVLPIVYMGVSLSLFFVILVIEKNGVFNAYGKSFQLTHKQWGWTFLLLLVSFIMVYVIYILLSIPGFIIGFTSAFHNLRTTSNPYKMFGMTYIIYTSIVSCIAYIIYTIPAFLLGFQYFSIVESIEKHSLIRQIGEIGNEE